MTHLASAADTTTHREVYFIDGGLTDVDTLLAALPEGAPWYVIDPTDDGVQQMAEVLADHAGLTAVHVLAHGTPGRMHLGNASIDRAALLRQVCQWEEIGAALYPDGDLLLYACELADGRRGTDFIDAVYQLTGANIAASRSLVGAAALGGSWDLGARVGPVKARALDVPVYADVLAAPTVIDPAILDVTFNQPLDAADPGVVSTSFDALDGAATAVLVDFAGKVIVAGSVADPGASTSTFYVARYNADGSPDTTFSGDGMATAFVGASSAAANAIALDSLARIVAVGSVDGQYAIARFNDNGTLDTSFGVGGELIGSFGAAAFSTANGIAFAGNDIVIAGTADGADFGVARIDDTGTVVQSVTTDIAGISQDFVAAVAVLADSTILVAGSTYDGAAGTNFVLANYNLADLSLTGLGGTGIVNLDFGGGVDLASAMAIDNLGRAVLVGTRLSGADQDFVIARYNTDGSLDASFGSSGGWVVTDFGGNDEAFAVAIQGDGKIVVSGRTLTGGVQYDTVFARYNADGSLDTGFGTDGLMTVAVNLGAPNDDYAAAMTVASDGEIIAVGSASDGTGHTNSIIINLTPVVPTLAPVAEDTANPLGASVLSLVGAKFSDPDVGDALGGVAIVGDDSAGQGVWEYSSDNGGSWFAVGLVDINNGLLVAANDLLRFVPAADFSGTPGGLTMHLVDTLSGVSFSAGGARQMLLNGSATAGVSVDTVALSTSVTAVADAPTMAAASLPAVLEGDPSPAGASVMDLFGAGFADVDVIDVLAGIAIAGDTSTTAQGVWEYSVDGVVWSAVGPVSAGAALLLDAAAQLRFVPGTDFQGVPGGLAVHAVDSSAAVNFTIDPGLPQTFDTTTDLETSGVAVASVGLSVNVTNVNDAPTIAYSMMPDPTFGSGGLVSTEFGVTINELAVGVALQGSGQIVVAGSTFEGVSTQFAVARYDANGNLDASFGTGGKVTTQFVEGNATAEAVTVAPVSSKILVAGSVTDGFQSDFAIARYNAVTGALDTSFGGDGMVTTAFGGEDVATSMSIDGGGQTVVAGYSDNGTGSDFALARYDQAGNLDLSFSGDGIATLDFGASDQANAVLALGNGKVIVAGDSGGVFAVARFNEDGTLDTTFSGDGMLTTDVGGNGFSIATTILEQADGKILVGGYASGNDFAFNFALVRYNTDGSLDLGFGVGGMVTTDFGHGDDQGASVIIDTDGKILLSGNAANADGGKDMAFARYNADGSLDASFGTAGLLQLPLGSGSSAAIASTLTGGNVLAAGWAVNVDGTTDFAVLQLTAATSVALAAIDEDAAPVGDTVSNLFANNFHDVDGDTLAGVAVSANTATSGQGVWQYSIDAGSTWSAVGNVSASAALLLAGDSLLRFLPAPNYNGTPDGGLQVHLVDSSTTATFTGAVRQFFDTTTAGPTSAVSASSIGLVTTVNSINDAPTGSDATVTVLEDAARVLTAADFGFADVDAGDVLASVQITDISLSGTLTLGGLTVFASDVIQRAEIDAGLLVFQPLADENGAAYATVSFIVNDGTAPAALAKTLTFDVTAVNDAPVLTVDAAGAVTEDATVPSLTDTGVLSFSDADVTDTVTVTSAYNTDAVWSGGTLSVAQIAALTTGFSNDQSSWNYSVANAALQFLGAGETVSFSYTVTATDNSGALNNSDSAVVTMTLTGTNDAPVLTVDVAGAVTESATAPTLTDSGALSFVDVDSTDLVTVSSAYNSDAVWSGGTLSAGQIAALTVGFSNDQNSWDYSVANTNLQFLAAGETVTFSFTVTATDNSGAGNNSHSQIVTMTLTGIDAPPPNNAPVLTVDVAGAVTEDATAPTLTDSGVLSFSDADAGNIVTVSSAYNSDAVWSGGTLSVAQIAALTAGFSNDQSSWNYSVANAALQFLGAGETVSFSYTVTATDNSGALNNSDSAVVTMTLTGTNDAPVLTSAAAALGGGSEGQAYSVSRADLLTGWTDVDGDPLAVANVVANHGTVIDNLDGTFTVMPSAYYNGSMSLNYDVIDGKGGVVAAALGYTLAAVRTDVYVAGTAGHDELWGDQVDAGSFDTLDGGDGDDGLNGLGGDDTLIGGAGDDWLTGGAGVDAMTGGVGNDVYVVDNALDNLNEGAGQGIDTVRTSLGNYTLGGELENLVFTGSGNYAGTGNAVANVLYGATGGDTLDGQGGDDSLMGMAGDDTLDGSTGDDWLNGGAGADAMTGGSGNDVYVVEDDFDTITEIAGQGIDTVRTSTASYTLGAEVENMVFTGTGSFAGTGNQLDNVIYAGDGADTLVGLGGVDSLLGMGGNDTLVGGTGNDWLTGGAGDDVFVFSATGFGHDRVVDFDADPVGGQDLLDLSGLGITAATFGSAVTIQDLGADVLLNFAGGDSIHLVGIGDPATITVTDFILAS